MECARSGEDSYRFQAAVFHFRTEGSRLNPYARIQSPIKTIPWYNILEFRLCNAVGINISLHNHHLID